MIYFYSTICKMLRDSGGGACKPTYSYREPRVDAEHYQAVVPESGHTTRKRRGAKRDGTLLVPAPCPPRLSYPLR